jgi:YHS domain-containing protein
MMRKSRQLLVGLSAGLLLVFLTAQAGWAKSMINTNWRGLAVKGYDVVAYFTLGTPTKGDSQFSYDWEGATWRFANAAHLEAFKAAPEKYAPQYGGY